MRFAEFFGGGRERREELQSWQNVSDNAFMAIMNTRLYYLQKTGVRDWATTDTVALSIADSSSPHATVAESLEVVFDMEGKREIVDSVRLAAPSYETVSPVIDAVEIQLFAGDKDVAKAEFRADDMQKIDPDKQAAVEDITRAVRDRTDELRAQ